MAEFVSCKCWLALICRIVAVIATAATPASVAKRMHIAASVVLGDSGRNAGRPMQVSLEARH
jgi:hypothetical protein